MLTYLTAGQQFGILLFAPFGGRLADRWTPRVVMAASQAGMGFVAMAAGFLSFFGLMSPLLAIVAGCAAASMTAIDMASRGPLLVGLGGERPIMQSLSMDSVLLNFVRMTGPVLGGIVFATFGLTAALAINAVVSFLCSAMIFCIRATPASMPDDDADDFSRPSLESGPAPAVPNALPYLMLFYGIMGLLISPYLSVWPAFHLGVLNGPPATMGWFYAAGGMGGLFANISISRARRLEEKLFFVFFGLSLSAFGVAALSLAPGFATAFASGFLINAGQAFSLTALAALGMRFAPEGGRGKVSGYLGGAYNGFYMVGSLLMGIEASYFGIRTALGIHGVLALVLILFGYVFFTKKIRPVFRSLDMVRK